MTRKEQFNYLIYRIRKPENDALKQVLESEKGNADLRFHIIRLKSYFKNWEEADDITRKLLELDFDVSLRKANEIMDKQGWA